MLTHQFIRRSLLPMLVLPFVLPLAAPELSFATDLPIYDGLGGNTDREDCPKGWYLVGLVGKTGSSVDRIAPVCAAWLRGTQVWAHHRSARRSEPVQAGKNAVGIRVRAGRFVDAIGLVCGPIPAKVGAHEFVVIVEGFVS